MSDDAFAHNFKVVIKAVEQVNDNLQVISDQVTDVHTTVGRVSTDLDTTKAELFQLRAEFQEFVQTAQRTAAVQRSETVLGNVEAALEREYGHYKVVRRTSIGTLQAFDIGNVSNRTVQQVSEELMIQTPRYWLAPALVGLAAWSRDNKDLTEKSIDAAFSRDSRKTSLFFALVLRRQGRMEAATRWLRHYLGALDPRALGREFAVILESAAQDAFGTHGRVLISEQLGKWNAQLRGEPEIVRAQVDAWVNELSIHRGTVDDDVYPHLSKITPQWDRFKDLLERASALGFTTEKFTAVRETPTPVALSVQDQLDDILELLVTEYDEEELPFQRDAVYHRAVIDSGGDLERAQETADALNVALEETADVVSLQTQTAMHPEMYGVSVSAQKVAIGGSRSDFRDAVGTFTADYRSRYLDQLDLELGPEHSNFAITLGFEGWKTTTAVLQSHAEAELVAAWKRSVAAYLERVRFKEIEYVKFGGIALVVSILGFLIFGAAGGAFVMLLAGGIAGFMLWRKKTEADEKYASAQKMAQQALEFSVDIYRAATAEYVDAVLAYKDADSKEADLLALIDGWPTVVDDELEVHAS